MRPILIFVFLSQLFVVAVQSVEDSTADDGDLIPIEWLQCKISRALLHHFAFKN